MKNKRISDVIKRLNVIGIELKEDEPVTGIAIDSRKVKPGYVYFVTTGNERYVEDAVRRGAICLVAEQKMRYPHVRVDDVRKSLALACADFYDNPERKLKIVGVIGTNGKTSVTDFLYQMLRPYKKAATVGTLGVRIGEETVYTGMTTPDPPELYQFFDRMRENGIEYVFCEITAHAIYYRKFYGIRCEACIYTNLTQDHLDFFGDLDSYAAVKTGYFTKENTKLAIVNADDPYATMILQRKELRVVRYGLHSLSDVTAMDIRSTNGLSFTVNAFHEVFDVSASVCGEFNVYNILACIAFARCIGRNASEIRSGVMMIKSVPGRAEVLNESPKIVLDFAHTPDGLEKILTALRTERNGELIVVIGCGGNRDKGKRPIMGGVATRLADVCVFTSDNPRLEDPEEIIRQIEAGAERKNYVKIVDRASAIEYAIRIAGPDDCVAICGKGAEEYFDCGGVKIPYSDASVCRSILESRR